MSHFFEDTRNPDTGQLEKAEWLDDYFGHHSYAVRFPSTGKVFRPSDLVPRTPPSSPADSLTLPVQPKS